MIAQKVTGPRSGVSFWLDLGNHATGGQFVLGQPWNWKNKRSATRLRTVAELFPELIHGAFVNIAGSRVQPLAADAAVWRAVQRRGKRRVKGR
jgi:hypothetical protein